LQKNARLKTRIRELSDELMRTYTQKLKLIEKSESFIYTSTLLMNENQM
jgi:hypothetical protein